MRYYSLRDQKSQNQFDYYWMPGTQNDADYFTKHHPIKHHLNTRSRYVQDKPTAKLHMLMQPLKMLCMQHINMRSCSDIQSARVCWSRGRRTDWTRTEIPRTTDRPNENHDPAYVGQTEREPRYLGTGDLGHTQTNKCTGQFDHALIRD